MPLFHSLPPDFRAIAIKKYPQTKVEDKNKFAMTKTKILGGDRLLLILFNKLAELGFDLIFHNCAVFEEVLIMGAER